MDQPKKSTEYEILKRPNEGERIDFYEGGGVMVKAMDCGIVVSEFVLQSCYYVHFPANTLEKCMNPLILPAMDQIVPLLFFLENGFVTK